MYNIKYSGTFKNINDEDITVQILEEDLEIENNIIEDYWISSSYDYFVVYINTEVAVYWNYNIGDRVKISSADGDFINLNGIYRIKEESYDGGYIQLYGTPDELSGFSGSTGKLTPYPKELLFSVNPLIINFKEVNDIFQPVQTSGVDLNLFSDYNFKYLDLYSDDLQKYKINVLKEGTEHIRNITACSNLSDNLVFVVSGLSGYRTGDVIEVSGFTGDYDVINGYHTVYSVNDSSESVVVTNTYITITPATLSGISKNITLSNTIIFQGFINSDIYNEPLHSIGNYEVAISANDGLTLLNNVKYLDSNNQKYTGIKKIGDVVYDVLSKLNLEFDLYWSLSTYLGDDYNVTFDSFGGSVLIDTYIYNENYYDEDGNPETCFKVIDEVLKPFGCHIVKKGTDFYILDNIATHRHSTYYNNRKYPVYNIGPLLKCDLGDLSDIKFNSTNQTLDYVSPYNSIKLNYSSYRFTKLEIKDVFKNIKSTIEYDTNPDYSFIETNYFNSNYFSGFTNTYAIGNFCNVRGTTQLNNNINFNCYKIFSDNNIFSINDDTKTFKLLYNFPHIIKSTVPLLDIYNNYNIKVKFNFYIRTANFLTDSYEDDDIEYTRLIDIYTNLRIADSDDGYEKFIVRYYDEDYNNICDKWNTAESLFKINNRQGDLTFEFHHYRTEDNISSVLYIKDVVISLCDCFGNDIEKSDVEIKSYTNEQFKNEKKTDIKLYQGTNSVIYPCEKGSLLNKYTTYSFDSFVNDKVYQFSFNGNENYYRYNNNLNTFSAGDFIFTGNTNEFLIHEDDLFGNDATFLSGITNGDVIKVIDVELGLVLNCIYVQHTYSALFQFYALEVLNVEFGFEIIEYIPILTFKRKYGDDVLVENTIEKLLLNSYISNYKNKKLKLTVDIKNVLEYSNIGKVSYNNYFPNDVFIITSNVIDVQNNSSQITLENYIFDEMEIIDI